MTAETIEKTEKTEKIEASGAVQGLFGRAAEAIVDLVERAQSSVVQIRTQGRGIGAGVIWGSNGTILTNHHVVADENRAINVLLTDGRELEAKVIARNPSLDLALLQVAGANFTPARIGDSAKARVGELVFAIGHPWGRRGVVTAGIISGLGEMRQGRNGKTAPYIRSDVRLAPGNSGGPLLDATGAVIGINAMIFGGDLSVAIPTHAATQWVASLNQDTGTTGSTIRLGTGVQPVELRTEKPGDPNKQKLAGLLVIVVEPESLAARNGLLVGDVLFEVNGQAVSEVAQLRTSLNAVAKGQNFALRLMRAGQPRTLEVRPETVG